MILSQKHGRFSTGLCTLLLCLLLTACTQFIGAGGNNAGGGTTTWYTIHIFLDHSGWGITSQGIIHTEDDGQHWHNVTPSALAGTSGFSGLISYFLDSQVGWLVQTGLTQYIKFGDKQQPQLARAFHTADGGKSWQSSELPDTANTYADTMSGAGFIAGPMQNLLPQSAQGEDRRQIVIRNISATDAHNAWITVARTATHTGGGTETYTILYVRIWHTTDNGGTWSKSWETTDKNNAPEGGAYFVNSTMGLLRGTTPLSLLLTNDGGKSWQEKTLPANGLTAQDLDVSIQELPTFFDSNNGAVTLRQYAPGQHFKYFPYITHDGGQTWQAATTVDAPEPIESQQEDMTYLDAQHWMVVGNNAAYKTNDGGQNWQTITLPSPYSYVSNLSFVSAQIGWGIGINSSTPTPGASPSRQLATDLLHTIDGGRTWQKVSAQIG